MKQPTRYCNECQVLIPQATMVRRPSKSLLLSRLQLKHSQNSVALTFNGPRNWIKHQTILFWGTYQSTLNYVGLISMKSGYYIPSGKLPFSFYPLSSFSCLPWTAVPFPDSPIWTHLNGCGHWYWATSINIKLHTFAATCLKTFYQQFIKMNSSTIS